MKFKLKLIIFVYIFGVFMSMAIARGEKNNQAHLDAAYGFLKSMQIDKTYSKSIESIIDLQIKADPQIKQYRKIMLKFFSKYLSWDSLKDDLARLYMEEFTSEELKEMTRFYKTPVGMKAARLVPKLMKKGGELGMKRVQEHMSELQLMVAEESKRLTEKNTSGMTDEPDQK